MVTGQLLAEDILRSEARLNSSHPTDSSRILLGLMSLARRTELRDPGADDAHPLGGAIDRNVLRSLLSALQFRDTATVRHCRRSAILAVGMAKFLGWEGRQLKLLEVAALLHDIGKIGVPDNILFKPGQLSTDERELMALHHNIGVDVLQASRADHEVLEIIVQAHSHYNGATGGYKRIGSDIHQGARLLAVADAYDSLTTDQVYRKAKTHKEAMEILTAAAGTQFDGNVIAALSRWMECEGNPLARTGPDGQPPGTPTGPVSPEDAIEANSLCHIFSYLYVLESLYDGFYLVDSDLKFVVWNRGVEKLLGRTPGEMLGRVWSSRTLVHADKYGQPLADGDHPLKRVVANGKAATTTVKLQKADGKWIEVESQSVPLLDRNGQLLGVAEIFRDISRTGHRPQEYRELKLAASRDPLTSVANRGELETQLSRMLTEFSQREDAEPFSILFLDIDRFKSINDTHGHLVGDQVLVDTARLLQHETYSGELIGRYGGEEFVVLCPDTDLEQAIRRAERLRTALCKQHIGKLTDRKVTASFGVTVVERGDSIDSILGRADTALFEAKQTGRNKTCSRTGAQLQADKSAAADGNASRDPFVFTNTFHAVVAADMVVYKLGGFVNDHKAAIKEASPQRAVLRVGSGGLLGFWGAKESRQPVELELTFGNQVERSAASSAKQIAITVHIRPLGWVKDAEAFQSRAKRVLKSLRAYFVAE